LRGDYAGYRKAGDDAEDDARADQGCAHADYQAEDIALLCSEGHANSDFVRAASSCVSEDAVDADGDHTRPMEPNTVISKKPKRGPA